MRTSFKKAFLSSCFSFCFALCAFVPAAHAQSSTLSGWAWSDTVGWISFSGTGYGVSMDPATGLLTGDAWSNNIGWIQFGGLSGWPTGGGTTGANAGVNLSTGALTGWARACDGTSSGDCSSMTSRTDGWDGWISLSGTGYGPTYSASTGFSGYSWGSDVVGWISWSPTTQPGPGCNPLDGVCGPGNGNPPAVTINASPNPVTAGQSTTLTWSATGSPTGCSMTSSPSNTPNGSEASTSLGTASGAINSPTTFSLTCTNSSGSGSNSVTISTTTTSGGNGSSGVVSMWLDNIPAKTAISIHPSGKVTLNWDESAFYNQYSSDQVTCLGLSSNGKTVNGWTNAPSVPYSALNNLSTTTISSLSVGLYSLQVQCRAFVNLSSISSTTNPVTITVTNSTIHEQ